MQPPTSVTPVSTGFSNFDTLLQTGGIPTGTICTVRSDPSASAYEFLLSIMQSNLDQAHFVTTARRKSTVVDSLHALDSDIEPESKIIDLSEKTTGAELLEAIGDRSVGRRDVLIIDSLNSIADVDDRTYSELYRELKRIAVETDAVVFCHYLSGEDSSRSVPPIVDYLTDLLLAISVTMAEEGIKQRLWIERLPVGAALKESQQDTRLVSITDSSEQLSLHTGGRI